MTVEKETNREDWDRLRKKYPAIDPEESNVAESVFQETDEELEVERRQKMGQLLNQKEDARLAATLAQPINTTGITGSLEDKTQWKAGGSMAVQPIDTQENSKPLYLHELSEEAREKLSKKGACVALDDLPKEDQEKLKSGRPISFDKLSKDVQEECRRLSPDEMEVVREKLEAREDIKGMTPDMVNHPSHYTHGKIECIDGIEESMTTEAFRGYCKGAAIKYLWRYERKGKPLEDLQKAQWYLVKLISSHQ